MLLTFQAVPNTHVVDLVHRSVYVVMTISCSNSDPVDTEHEE